MNKSSDIINNIDIDTLQKLSNLGYFYVINRIGFNIKELTVVHTLYDHDKPFSIVTKTYENVAKNNSIGHAAPFPYITGLGSPYDYWYIKIVYIGLAGEDITIQTKNHFFCSVSSEDDGLVYITLNSDFYGYFLFSESSGCYISLK
ncbi:hypothetical protein [Morganella psychrotolerans]|uniref:hypothetical protein n=1 Tax=Morganella psychrotolerans TaxID=368603 RepID=UPI0039B05D8B